MHIQCDEEFILHFDPEELSGHQVASDRYGAILGHWNASVMEALGSQFLLYVHTKSLYSTVDLLDFPDADLLNQSILNLRGKILEMLRSHYHLSDPQEGAITQPFEKVTFGLIEDRRMQHIIEDITVGYQKRFVRAKQANMNGEIRLWELEDDLNNIQRRHLGGATPVETLRQLIWSGLN